MRRRALIGVLLAVAVCFSVGVSTRCETVEKAAEDLLVSTEMLLMSQAQLSILALNLIFGDMQSDETTVKEDKENLNSIIDAIDYSAELIVKLKKSSQLHDEDIEYLRIMARVNDNLKNAAKSLIEYCDDGKNVHFSEFQDEMESIVSSMEKIEKLAE